MRNSMNPYGGVNPLIDKMIGNAYDIVKYVAKYLKEIRYLAENMQYVYAAANGNRVVFSLDGDGTASLTIPVPLAGQDYSSIAAVSVIAVGLSGAVYTPASGTFNYGLTPTFNVQISITGGGSVPELLTAEYRVTITQNIPAE